MRAPLPRDGSTQVGGRDFAACLLLAMLALVPYAGVLSHDFVSWDDPLYVTENARVLRGLTPANVAWAFTTFSAANWHPLTWLSHMLDTDLFGPVAGPRIGENALLHAANACLLWLVLRSLTGASGRSFVVAAVFAAHPLRVESVAWLSSRKDVLSGLFFLLALGAHGRWAMERSRLAFGACIGLFAFALLAKPTVVTLPFVLLLVDVWPLGRGLTRRVIVEKLPLFALAAASCALTLAAQRAGDTLADIQAVSLAERVGNAIVSYARYLELTIVPTHLAPIHPHVRWLGPGGSPAVVIGAAVLLSAITATVVRMRRRAPYGVTGWLWFVGMLVPTIGLVQVGPQAFAERYTYLPQIGILLAAVWAAHEMLERWTSSLRRPAGVVATVLLLGALGFASARQAEHWRSSLALFEHTVRATDENEIAWNQLGLALEEADRTAEAEAAYRRALDVNPGSAESHTNLATLLSARGADDDARAHLEAALRTRPDFAPAHTNLGNLLFAEGQLDAALAAFDAALAAKPALIEARLGRAAGLRARGDVTAALVEYEAIVTEWPDVAGARNDYAVALATAGRLPEAIPQFEAAVLLERGLIDARFNLGVALRLAGRTDEAEAQLQELLRLRPDYAEAERLLEEMRSNGDPPESPPR